MSCLIYPGPDFGTEIVRCDDCSQKINFTGGFTFPFYGSTYNSVFVNSNGNLTFTVGDTYPYPSFEMFIGGGTLPRIAPFWVDLFPPSSPAGGGVFYSQEPTRFIVTWVQVPYFFGGAPPFNTFQVVLYNDGRVAFAYEYLDSNTLVANNEYALVGIAAGNGGDSCVFRYDSLTNSDPQQTVVAPPGALDQKQLFFDFVDQHCVMTVRSCRGLKFFTD